MRLPAVDLDGADWLAASGAALVLVGTWGLWGWAVAALVLGGLFLAAATARELWG